MTVISRRTALKLLTLSAAALALPATARRLPPVVAVERALFPQSVASGDPQPGSVVLWTRLAPAAWGQDVVLEVAEDPGFEAVRVERAFRVGPATDGCLKVKVQGLEPDRSWHYRFVAVGEDGVHRASPAGRTRTAPAPDADRDLRFAVMSCQDFNGRWYNTLLPLLDQELDAILHLGDFVYETTGDPSFQDGAGRRIVFEDAEGALSLGDGGFQAARSLDNYRQLHREYRTDPVLQQLLERAPLIAIWDDHEFADDSWQDVATFHDGRRDERDATRRRAAEQAWFEYMPADLGGGFEGASVDDGALHPNARIWRDFRFGKRAALAFTDYRSARPDHLVPEDAFPGGLAYDEAALREALPKIGESFEEWRPRLQPYVHLSDPDYRRWRRPLARALTRAYRAEGLATDVVRRRVRAILAAPIALPVANAILAKHDAGAPFFLDAGQIPETPDLPRGLSWAGVGKSRLFDAIGSRYFVLAEGYGLLAALRAAEIGSALGEVQSAWLDAALARHADADWRFIGSSVSFTPLRLDLRRPEVQAPPAWAHEVLLNVDHWDGFPVEREAWLDRFAGPGAVLLSGDIHASFASQHRKSVVEFTVPAVSSKPLGAILARNASGDEATRAAGARLAEHLDGLLRAGYPGLRYAQTRRNGTVLLEVGQDTLVARYFEIEGERVGDCLYDDPAALAGALREAWFRVEREPGRLLLEPIGARPAAFTR
jgi:alkaline phosphatase D